MSRPIRAGLAVVVGLLVVASIVSVPGVVADPALSEKEFVQPAPERGDPYFEAAASDGSWISYDNPRDEYRTPYLGEGSAKICVALYNENGEPIVGESVPDTTVTIPTGDTISWHSDADPLTVQFPMTDHYDRPLDADQFGTSDLPQGDGYLDSHCYEFHGLSDDDTITYGEAKIDGEHADRIDVAGYNQQTHAAWDSNVDPIADAKSYEEAGGGWTFRPDASHGQVIVVLQLDSPEDGSATSNGANETNEDNREDDGGTDEKDKAADVSDEKVTDVEKRNDTDADNRPERKNDANTQSNTDQDNERLGTSIVGALATLAIIVIVRARR